MKQRERHLVALTRKRLLAYLQRSRLGLFIRELLRLLAPRCVKLYIVGGTVRDFAEGSSTTRDIDLMITGTDYETLGAILDQMHRYRLGGLSAIHPQGSRFGIYKVVLKGYRTDIDIALARREISTGPGHRDFNMTMQGVTSYEDSSRRDFSINALFFRLCLTKRDVLSGRIVDYQGGITCLLEREIRAVGDPVVRFREDPLRMLRALRLKNERRGFTIEEGTWRALRALVPNLLGALPPERISSELVRSLRADATGALRDWKEGGALREILPEIDSLDDRAREILLRRFSFLDYFLGARKPSDTLLLSCLLVDIAEAECSEKMVSRSDYGETKSRRFLRTFREASFFALEQPGLIARRLAFPGIQDIVQMTNDFVKLLHYKTLNNRRAAAERIFQRSCNPRELLSLYQAHQKARICKKVDFDFLLDKFSLTPHLLDGDDLLAMGIRPGPHLQMIMEAVRDEELWDRIPSRNEAVAFAAALFNEEFEALNRHLSALEALLVANQETMPEGDLIDLIGRTVGGEIIQLLSSNTLRLIDSYRERSLLRWVMPELDEASRQIPALYNETMKGLDLLLREEDEVAPLVLFAFILKETGRNSETEAPRHFAATSGNRAARLLRRLGAHPALIEDVVFLVSNLWVFLLVDEVKPVKLLVETTREDLVQGLLHLAHYMLRSGHERIPHGNAQMLAFIRKNRAMWRMEYLRRKEEERFENLFISEEDLMLAESKGGFGLSQGRRLGDILRQLSRAQERGLVTNRREAKRFVATLLKMYEEWEGTT